MKAITLLVGLLLTAPAFAQSRVYTNADLGKPLTAPTRLDPAAAAAILAPNQFVGVAPARPRGAQVIVFGSPTAGPFGEFRPMPPPRRLDGSSFLTPPWTNYAGPFFAVGGVGRFRVVAPGAAAGSPRPAARR